MAKRTAKAGKKSQPGRLRIVAGNWRSRVLDIADVPGLRPTSERIRETLFNWLTPQISGARCLDLFAGSGALGLEALSRGAAETVFVEKSSQAVETLRNNIAALGSPAAIVHNSDAIEFLKNAAAGEFDIVFLDPPFAADMLGDLCRLLDKASIFANSARVYLEEDRAKPEVTLPRGWQVIRTKNAGNVRYSLVSPEVRG
ncbi:MAG: 16S rRNA (guanine(966)-N(2))-methyltransferase RsmD [Gammaproteobacteria bacterium]|jgi:16S rRNA (guanine966-N2)-methyltransferase|nr:16S rRNA (guanine(966)-N(2))-methyltransferase RsmD [Gammaproteobacteria bacterium]MDH3749840.1 16S rRNA (guanine(966)-N(2))-methyltransferase RsmD [Gammaproteobacteria bacterium]MDH3804308.1 16S rRNA (guanine(966)-N(2))-methyltransferase RsmD [Gammaproteobacteria bacterium]